MRLRTSLAAVLATAATAATALGVSVSSAPSAEAVNNVAVVLGDSLAADPTVVDYLGGKVANVPGARLNLSGCGADGLFPRSYGRGAGKETRDYTCAGASYRTGGIHISEEARRAQAAGDLSPATAEVVILAGANDTYPYIINDKMPVERVGAQLYDAVRATVGQVRAMAPNARIKLVGYPQVSMPNGEVCVISPGGQPAVTPGVNIRSVEDHLEGAVRVAAERSGAQFVSMKAMSAGRDTCSPNRWIAGIADTTAAPHNLMFHMTHEGLTAVGTAAGRA